MSAERRTVAVSGKSWHGRLYRRWLRDFGWKWNPRNGLARQENLCHYVRVVLLWAPLSWLFTAHPRRWPALRPWMFVSGALAGGTLGVCFARWPTGTWEALREMGFFLLVLAIVAVVSAGLVCFVHWVRRHKQRERGDSFAHVAWEFVRAKKARICPYIEREDME